MMFDIHLKMNESELTFSEFLLLATSWCGDSKLVRTKVLMGLRTMMYDNEYLTSNYYIYP